MHDPDAEFWGDDGAGAILYSKESGRFLVGMRSEKVREPGTLSTFGGAIENGDSAKETVEQEVMEEVGYFLPMEIKELPAFESPDNDFRYHNFVAVIDNDFQPQLNWENNDAIWVTLEELKTIDEKKLHFGLTAILNNKDSMAVLESVSGNNASSTDELKSAEPFSSEKDDGDYSQFLEEVLNVQDHSTDFEP